MAEEIHIDRSLGEERKKKMAKKDLQVSEKAAAHHRAMSEHQSDLHAAHKALAEHRGESDISERHLQIAKLHKSLAQHHSAHV